jgi:hypothetical protein
MVPKKICTAIVGAALLAWSGLAVSDEYRPDQFLGLDLSRAVLSPKPLGPPAEFTPGPLDVSADPGGEGAQASSEPKAAPTIAVPSIRMAHLRGGKPPSAPRTRLARRHGNPLDAQAFDTRIQVWPCRSGGICNWRPQGR